MSDKPSTIADEVRDNYASFPEVVAVFASIDSAAHRYWVFTSSPQYDDELMTEFIKTEMQLMAEFPHHSLDIRYVPTAMVGTYSDATGYAVTLLYLRQAVQS